MEVITPRLLTIYDTEIKKLFKKGLGDLVQYGFKADWEEDKEYVPRAGSIIIYADENITDDGNYIPSIKIGDGTTYVADLPFITMGNINYSEMIICKDCENWELNKMFVPKFGSIMIYSDKYKDEKTGTPIPAIKIGDGTTYVADLPFVTDYLLNKIEEHINDTEIHVSAFDRKRWDNKVTSYIDEDNLVLTKLYKED